MLDKLFYIVLNLLILDAKEDVLFFIFFIVFYVVIFLKLF
jgi:hypothetical protein